MKLNVCRIAKYWLLLEILCSVGLAYMGLSKSGWFL